MEHPTCFSRRWRDWYPSVRYPWTRILQAVGRCVCSAPSNQIHPSSDNQLIAYATSSSCKTFIHNEVFWGLSNSIFKLSMQFVTNYVSNCPYHESVLAKPSLGLPRGLLHPDYQINDLLMMSAYTDPSNTANIFCTPFLHCTSSAIAALKVLTPQQ